MAKGHFDDAPQSVPGGDAGARGDLRRRPGLDAPSRQRTTGAPSRPVGAPSQHALAAWAMPDIEPVYKLTIL
ncbi:hypothetical protein ABT279_47855, partial [Amycolatopsis sp. NPDC000673]|uniref:hypothetical protein n=1 Tax=Amycolatopsis sp. NPDC000673 TaxID=3154267 RepID=UPI00333435D9